MIEMGYLEWSVFLLLPYIIIAAIVGKICAEVLKDTDHEPAAAPMALFWPLAVVVGAVAIFIYGLKLSFKLFKYVLTNKV